MLLEGIFPAIATPFYPDAKLYLRKLEHNVNRYSRTPVAGLVVLGSTGEAVMLSDDETREVLRTAREAAAPEKVLLAGVARESLKETLRLAEYAAAQQYDAVLVRTPNYYAPNMDSVAMGTYYRALADSSPLPVLLYSIPRYTHCDVDAGLVGELAHHPNIVGIKDSSGSLERLAALVAATANAPKRPVTVTATFQVVTGRMKNAAVQPEGAATFVPVSDLGSGAALAVAPPVPALRTRTKQVGFQVLTGSAEKLLASLEAGASGAVLAFAAFAPQAAQEIYTAWKDNDLKLALEKQQRIVEASAVVVGRYGIAGVKHALDLNGYYGGRPRLPLLPLTAAEQDEVSAVMAGLRN